jgi:DNA repair photolyase
MKTSTLYHIKNSALKIIPGNEVIACNLPFRLDTYLGCGHNCTYCYARNLLSFRNLWNPENPRHISPEDLRKVFKNAFTKRKRLDKIDRLIKQRFPIRLGTNSDCFQPVESRLRITEKTLQMLNEWDYPYIINTKSDMVADEPYRTLLIDAPGGCVVQFTIISLNEELAQKLETNAPSISRRIEAANKLANNGIHTQVRVSPIIPELTNDAEEMKKLFRGLRDVGVKDLIVEFLRYTSRINMWVKDAFHGEIDLDEIYRRVGCNLRPDGRPKADRDGYVRVPMRVKFKLYKGYKDIANKLGLNLYVCSEEYPEINECINCCGTSKREITDRFRYFKKHNSAATNTIACFIRERGEVSLDDVKNNFYCVDWDRYGAKWEHLEQFLINVKKKEERGETRYVYTNKFKV